MPSNPATSATQKIYQKMWRRANPEAVRRIWRKSRAKHKDKINEYKRKWRQTAAGKQEAYKTNCTRRARKLKAVPENVDLGAIARVYTRAAELRRWFAIEVDHIIPLSRGGLHEASNLQIIYKIDNMKKHNSLGFVPSVIFS